MTGSAHGEKSARLSVTTVRVVSEGELKLHRERLSVEFHVGVDEVIERIAQLRWVEPDLRHAQFAGIRDDKAPHDVRRERP